MCETLCTSSQDEVSKLRALTAQRNVMHHLISEHGGRIANTAGDSVLAEFPSVVDAVECALKIQEQLAAESAALPQPQEPRFRIGVHLGDVTRKDGDLFGDGVNIAARLQQAAEPGTVVISRPVRDQIHDRGAFAVLDLGELRAKNGRPSMGPKAIALRPGTTSHRTGYDNDNHIRKGVEDHGHRPPHMDALLRSRNRSGGSLARDTGMLFNDHRVELGQRAPQSCLIR